MDFLTLQGKYAKGEPDYRNTTTPTCLIGGEGGGGKSYGLRTAAFEILFRLRELGFPNRTVSLFCDTEPNLTQLHVSKLRTELGSLVEIGKTNEWGMHARLVGSQYNDLGRVQLRYAPPVFRPGKQKGGECDAMLIDELTSFHRAQFGEMQYQLRTSGGLPFVPLGASSNPDGIGNDYVRQLFPIPEEFEGAQDLPEYFGLDPVADAEELEEIARSLHYIPMRTTDNMTYEANKKSFDKIMRDLPPNIRRARQLGLWGLYAGGRFSQVSERKHGFKWADFLHAQGEEVYDTPLANYREAMRLIENADIMGWEVWASFDYGTDVEGASCLLFHVMDHYQRVWTFGEWYMGGMLLPEQARTIKPLLERFPLKWCYVDPHLKARPVESDRGLSRLQLFASMGVKKMVPGDNRRIEGWATLDWMFDRLEDGSRPNHPTGSICIEPASLGGCPHAMKQLRSALRMKSDPDDVDDMRGLRPDHAIDCLVGSTSVLTESGWRPLADIQVGDMVETRVGLRRVTDAWSSTDERPIVEVHLSNGRTIRGTEDHHIFSQTRGWIPLVLLRTGEVLLPATEPSHTSVSVVRLTRGLPPERVFDITVEGAHEFFAEGVLVHNCLRYGWHTRFSSMKGRESKPRAEYGSVNWMREQQLERTRAAQNIWG